jgi:hypothetical protein
VFVFDWGELATEPVIHRLYRSLGTDPAEPVADETRQILAEVCASVGGLRFADQRLGEADIEDFTLRLVEDACDHTLATLTGPGETPGYLQRAGSILFDRTIAAIEVVAVNHATANELDGLPGIGAKLASRVIALRRADGWYRSGDELAARVPGLGRAQVARLDSVLSYAEPTLLALESARDFDTKFQLVAALASGGEDREPVLEALELLAAVCGRNPHPASTTGRLRLHPDAAAPTLPTDWVAVLAGTDYHPALVDLFANAVASIEVCLFHAALGGPDHPTRHLLNSLVSAHHRGASVRVMLDSDRPTDPYLSTVINSAAKRFLLAHGVEVRSDDPEHLLHSKFVVVDSDVVVIGSHNWSTGSFFDYDDLSLVVKSGNLAGALLERFEALWQASEPQ